MHDVLVVGGGLAGVIAALTAQQAGARVLLASRSWGATALSTGALDLAYTPALSPHLQRQRRSLADHVQDIINHRPRHPYGVMGHDEVLQCLAGGYATLQRAVAGSGLDLSDLDLGVGNTPAASSLGTLMPAGSLFAPHRGLPLDGDGTIGILQFLGDGYFAAERLAAGFAHDAGRFATTRRYVVVPTRLAAQPPHQMARAFDDPAMLQRLELELQGKLDGLAGLLVPPVLGLQQVGAVQQRLRQRLGLPVVEALAHMPTVPGMRLQRALEAALHTAGVERMGEVRAAPDQAAAAFDAAAGELPTLRDAAGQSVAAKAVILASGRFIAGGVDWRDTSCEQLFGLPLVTELGRLEADSPHAVVRRAPVESHPLMTAGVQVNAAMQPMRRAAVAHPRLFAAGMVIGGFASRYSLCADGVALCTGRLAGRQAAAAAAAKEAEA